LDGADEVDSALGLINGRAVESLLREKIVRHLRPPKEIVHR